MLPAAKTSIISNNDTATSQRLAVMVQRAGSTVRGSYYPAHRHSSPPTGRHLVPKVMHLNDTKVGHWGSKIGSCTTSVRLRERGLGTGQQSSSPGFRRRKDNLSRGLYIRPNDFPFRRFL